VTSGSPATGTRDSIACQTMSFTSGSKARMIGGTSTWSLVVGCTRHHSRDNPTTGGWPLFAATTRAKSIGSRLEPRFPLGLQRVDRLRLAHAVNNLRNAERALFPVRLLDVHPLDGLGSQRCAAMTHQVDQNGLARSGHHDGPIDACRLAASIALDPREHPLGSGHVVPYPASCARRPAEGRLQVSRFLLPFSRRHWLLGSSAAHRGIGPSLRSAYRGTSPRPDPVGITTFHTHEM
jgi:hypothetical protein